MSQDPAETLAALEGLGDVLERARRTAEDIIAARRALDSAPPSGRDAEGRRRNAALDDARSAADAAIVAAWDELAAMVRPLGPIVDSILRSILADRLRLLGEALDVCVRVKNCVDPDPRRGVNFGELISPIDGARLVQGDRIWLGNGRPARIAGMSATDPAARALCDALAPLGKLNSLYQPELVRIRGRRGK